MTTTPARLMTTEELLAREDDGRLWELVEGVLREVPPASPHSSSIAVVICWALMSFVRPRRLGQVYGADAGFVLRRNPDSVRAPDAAFIRSERVPTGADRDRYVEGGPDLAVEVLSPTDRLTDVVRKVREYLAAGTQLAWVVEPKRRRVTEYVLGREPRVFEGDAVLSGGDVLPGFELPLRELFS